MHTAPAEADEWAGAGVGGAAAGSGAAALPTAPQGERAGCCGRRGFAASGLGVSLTLRLIPLAGGARNAAPEWQAGA
jgi:hypothetical protein